MQGMEKKKPGKLAGYMTYATEQEASTTHFLL